MELAASILVAAAALSWVLEPLVRGPGPEGDHVLPLPPDASTHPGPGA